MTLHGRVRRPSAEPVKPSKEPNPSETGSRKLADVDETDFAELRVAQERLRWAQVGRKQKDRSLAKRHETEQPTHLGSPHLGSCRNPPSYDQSRPSEEFPRGYSGSFAAAPPTPTFFAAFFRGSYWVPGW